MLVLALFAIAGQASAAVLQKRAISCPSVTPSLTSLGVQASATSFCSGYLGIQTQTATITSTSLTISRTITGATTRTQTVSITPASALKVVKTTTTAFMTVTPPVSTVTSTSTSTRYIDGNGVPFNKRGLFARGLFGIFGSEDGIVARAVVTAVAAKAVVTPPFFAGMVRADMSAACSCLAIPTPTITRTIGAKVTSTTTVINLSRTKTTTTTLPTLTSTSVSVKLVNKVVTAPVPIETAVVPFTLDVNSCPPDDTTTFICPVGTGEDLNGGTSSDIMCPVNADDGFGGNCVYWGDDGSPGESTLVMGDGSGDSANDQTRDATYGDADTDDCPSWADYTCAAQIGSRFAMLARDIEARKVSKRSGHVSD